MTNVVNVLTACLWVTGAMREVKPETVVKLLKFTQLHINKLNANNLPNNIKCATSITQFKNLLKHYMSEL